MLLPANLPAMHPPALPPAAVDLSIIIVNWNTASLLHACLASLATAPGLAPEIIVVDNASTDGSADSVARDFPHVRLICNTENAGFGRANNQGLRACAGRYALLLNSDTTVKPGALAALVKFMDGHPAAGACSPRLLRPNGIPQPYAFGGDPTLPYLLRRAVNQVIFHRYLHEWASPAVQEVDWVSGACLLARREAIAQAGLLDEAIFMYFEDNDWCLRLRQAGWKIYYYPEAEIIHVGGQSLRQNPSAQAAYARSLKYFYAKHYSKPAQWALRLLLPLYARVRR
jgi:N-acetylglucosaminyl-diphospho-decaprenol L-rhamnosyltransferase